jgi:hypothetical protein
MGSHMRILAFLFLILSNIPANAVVITLDADELAPGTVISRMIEGVTILSYKDANPSGDTTYSPVIEDVIVSECTASSDFFCNQSVFARAIPDINGAANWGAVNDAWDCERGSAFACRESHSHVMNIFFDSPTDFFSYESYRNSDPPGLNAFDSAGNLLFRCFSFHDGACFQSHTPTGTRFTSVMGFAREEADVARVMIGMSYGNGRIQELSVSVPEPATLLLLGSGIAAVLAFRRRDPRANGLRSL